jgi:hypothetical protein
MSNAAGLSVRVRCRRIHRLSVWGVGTAWAMAGGAALGTSAKSGIWGGVDASTMVEDVPSAATERQRAIVRERRKERRGPPLAAGDCGMGVGGSMHFSSCFTAYDDSEEQGQCLSHGPVSLGKIIQIPLQYQIVFKADAKWMTNGWTGNFAVGGGSGGRSLRKKQFGH